MAHGRKTGGRKKGTLNRTTGAVKAMILGALDSVGGQQFLVEQANKNPSAFLQLVGKIVPSEIRAEHTGEGGGPIEFIYSNLPKP